jgi:RNA polymerase sigma-70 factor (ECF subfamily)
MSTPEPRRGPAPDLQVLAARRDDARARTQLVRAVHQIVRRYCRALIGRSGRDFSRADHLADEVASAILREHRDEFGGPVPVEAIVYADMAPAVARALGDRPVPPHTPGRREPVSPERVHDHLGRLPPRSREVLVLRAFVGLSSEQVGRALGLPPDVVRQEQRRALTHLRSL